MIPWLAPGQPFPPLDAALVNPNGLLAATRELSVERLLIAYQSGIFPWYSAGEPVLWWSPDPRMVLFTSELRVSRSLTKTLRRVGQDGGMAIRLNSAFDAVMRACAEPRDGEGGTWITPEMIDAYGELHRRGLAISVEAWRDGQLAGGLYGVSLGRMFFGESMFARTSDASKVALVVLARILLREKVPVIDCQQNTRHLASLGARELRRADFAAHLATVVNAAPINWRRYMQQPLNAFLNGNRTD